LSAYNCESRSIASSWERKPRSSRCLPWAGWIAGHSRAVGRPPRPAPLRVGHTTAPLLRLSCPASFRRVRRTDVGPLPTY
jgi:hypothetical protein